MKEKILLDTDIGTEVDDAITLAYLLANPDADLMGITTVTGEAVQRARLASVLCRIAGKEIPIFPGCENPILISQSERWAPQASILDKWDHQDDFPVNQAVPFLQRTIRENPGQITLIGIAPLTNLALLFLIDPEIPSLLKKLVLMCGSPEYTRYDGAGEKMSAMECGQQMSLAGKGILENNALIDPHAAKIVYSAPVKTHCTVGLNVTSRLIQKPEVAEQLFASPLLLPVLDIAKEWFKDEKRITFHDPLAAVSVFHPEVCKFENGKIGVETQSQGLSGFTYWRRDENGPHAVATDVDADLFFRCLFEQMK